ncbi:MAG: response regulator [Bacteroidetes bacterium]|nr:response regulator [Fibrella sp.]
MQATTKKWIILVAEDDAAFRRVLTFQLIKAGYEVIIAHDGREALDWLHHPHQRPDVVLLDLLMPQQSGLDVLRVIRTLPYDLPVILMSQAERAIAREGVDQAAPDVFLAKPFAISTLLTTIQSLLPLHSQRNR